MITATDLEVRAGARTLLSTDGAALRVQPGDRIGLVGRNGAGKTTTMRILAGEGEPYAGTLTRTGEIGYLPQDPREGDLDVLARDRVLSARGLDTLLSDLEKQQALMAEVADDATRDRRYGATVSSKNDSQRLADIAGSKPVDLGPGLGSWAKNWVTGVIHATSWLPVVAGWTRAGDPLSPSLAGSEVQLPGVPHGRMARSLGEARGKCRSS